MADATAFAGPILLLAAGLAVAAGLGWALLRRRQLAARGSVSAGAAVPPVASTPAAAPAAPATGAANDPGATAELSLEQRVLVALERVIDPEIGLDIVALGMVDAVVVDGGVVRIGIAPTTAACPLGEQMVHDAERRVGALAGVERVEVELVFDPPWTPERMSERARRLLGWQA